MYKEILRYLLRLGKKKQNIVIKGVLNQSAQQSFKSVLLEILGDSHLGHHRAVPACHEQGPALAAWLSDSGITEYAHVCADPCPLGTEACHFIASFAI